MGWYLHVFFSSQDGPLLFAGYLQTWIHRLGFPRGTSAIAYEYMLSVVYKCKLHGIMLWGFCRSFPPFDLYIDAFCMPTRGIIWAFHGVTNVYIRLCASVP